jgi:RNA recognition motif-containing protein
MSSDYRPRGGGGNSSSGGGRRRRGGRGRSNHGGGGHGGEGRSYSNGSSSSAPKKKQSFLEKLLGFFTKKSKPEPKPFRSSSTARPDFKERTPREDRPQRDDRPAREERPKAEPVMQEIVSPKLYVGNLAYEAAESDLFDLFSKQGAVKNVEIAMDRRSNRSKGFGFVEMESLDTAKAAAEKLNRTDFMGRQIVVSGAKVDKRPINPREEDSTAPEADPHASSNPDATA